MGFSLAVLLGAGLPAAVSAQEPDTAALRRMVEQQAAQQQLGPTATQADVLRRLRESGLTRAQVRSRLQQLGMDPSLADQYFDALERGQPLPDESPSEEFMDALRRIGVPVGTSLAELDSLAIDSLRVDSAAIADSLRADSIAADSIARGILPIFGMQLFSSATTQFYPVTFGPVDPGYRLGPGDELRLILTGDVEASYPLVVSREGYLIIPDVGQVFVNGLTLGELEDRLYNRLGQAYSGLTRGDDATTHFQVSLGRLHTNQVYLVGEVTRPSSYQVSAVATVFNALYRAGGPSPMGTMRRIQVRRAGEVVRTVDVYDYLLRGDSRADVRLMQGDIVFVPVVGRRVGIRGAVRRPARYELLEGDGLRDLIEYAAGFTPEAVVQRVQIDRIVPPAERRPGVDRVLIDVDVQALMDAEGEPIPLRDGDRVHVFAVSDERRNRVALTGSVRRPGVFEWSPGLTLWDVIERADGLREEAYTARAHIFRLNEADGARRLIKTPLIADSAGRPTRDVGLADRDSIVVFSRDSLRNQELVTVDGFVKEPGTYPLAEGMTLRDLILAAGGFVHGAYVLEAELARAPDPLMRTDTTAHVVRVPLSGAPPMPPAGDSAGERITAGDARYGFAGVGRDVSAALAGWTPAPDELELRHGDHVFVRKAPGYAVSRVVTVSGEVAIPGPYVLRTREERLADIIQRAGGLTDEAYAPGARLTREGRLVGVSLSRALVDASGGDNIVLEAGDSIHVPELDPTVLVRGAVGFDTRALYQPGAGLGHYIDQAGGYTDVADEDRVSVTYANGERQTVDGFLFLSFAPDVEPGSTIFVPSVPESERGGVDWDRFLTRSLGIMSTTVTILLAIQQLDRGN